MLKLTFKTAEVYSIVTPIHYSGDRKYFLKFIPFGHYDEDMYAVIDLVTFIDPDKYPLSKKNMEISYSDFLNSIKDEYTVDEMVGTLTIKKKAILNGEMFSDDTYAYTHLMNHYTLPEDSEDYELTVEKGYGNKPVILTKQQVLESVKHGNHRINFINFLSLVYKNEERKKAIRKKPNKSKKDGSEKKPSSKKGKKGQV